MLSIKDNDLSHLYLAPSNIQGAGMGVFCKIDIPKDTIVESASTIPMPPSNVENTVLMDYVFNNPYSDNEFLIAFGYGSMYNHSDDPQMIYEYDADTKQIIYKAIKDIKANEELYISYGENWWTGRNYKTKVDVPNQDEPNIIELKLNASKKTVLSKNGKIKYRVKNFK
jgi:hypothetical protein